ncbi:MAG: ribbon-helix-helix protein, CopG family [Candidatus Poribacteria bacterium]|nr:ribbon-helix-helix protein, CopG family [Candidatus Poribacteria bacterium]
MHGCYVEKVLIIHRIVWQNYTDSVNKLRIDGVFVSCRDRTIEFSKQVDDILKELAEKNGTSKVEVLRRALSLYDYAKKETGKERHRKLSITDEEDKIIKDLIFQ